MAKEEQSGRDTCVLIMNRFPQGYSLEFFLIAFIKSAIGQHDSSREEERSLQKKTNSASCVCEIDVMRVVKQKERQLWPLHLTPIFSSYIYGLAKLGW